MLPIFAPCLGENAFFYGNVQSIQVASNLWKLYVFNSMLQQDLTSVFYNVSLLNDFSLSLYAAPNLEPPYKKKHVNYLKKALLKELFSLKMTETIKLVKQRLERALN